MRSVLYLFVLIFSFQNIFAQQTGNINGTIKDKNTQETLIGALVSIYGNDTLTTVTDVDGKFKINASVGTYSLTIASLGYDTFYQYNLNVSSGNDQELNIELSPESKQLDEVVISNFKTVRATNMVTPLATQRLTSEEIKVNPGGNFDVSKVIQVLPGVGGGTTANRNDIIIRGGGPSENVYYLDGIEIPVLNHFQTQGASGGATGILNVSFIDDVQLTSSAFDSKYDNALSGTFVIKQRNGNSENFDGNIRLSGSEVAATLEGPLSKNTTFMASARRSYLKYLFQLLDLPIRPDYWDFQYKVHQQINKKTEITYLGIGAIDNFSLKVPKTASAENEYIVRSNPLINQWNYTVGASLKRLVKNGFYTLALSRNMFYNGATQYENNATKTGNILFELGSHEIENKLRLDVSKFINNWKLSYGIGAQYVKYNADIFNTIKRAQTDSNGNVTNPAITLNTATAIDFFKIGAYAHASKFFFNDRLLFSGGLRTDMNSFTKDGMNPLKTISPRISFSYAVNRDWNIAASVGSYFKLPSYTSLGYRDVNNFLVNKNLDYINATHFTIGTQFVPRNDFRVTLEAFYKIYRHYPVSLTNGISMANIGTDFSAIGNDDYISTGKGRVYGLEAYVQQKLAKRLFYVISATFFKSEFSGLDGQYISSTWDYGYIATATLGYKFNRNWEVGAKYRIAGGQPYTPFDGNASRANYLTIGTGVYDYAQLNDLRLPFFHQLDLRVDKKYFFKKTSLDLYLDFQNVFLYKTPYLPKYTFERTADNSGFATTDGNPIMNDGSNAIPIILNDRSATIVPAIGFIFEF